MNTAELGNGSLAFILFCVFLVLKLLGIIAWSWWWVLAPIWVPIVLVSLFIVTALIVSILRRPD